MIEDLSHPKEYLSKKAIPAEQRNSGLMLGCFLLLSPLIFDLLEQCNNKCLLSQLKINEIRNNGSEQKHLPHDVDAAAYEPSIPLQRKKTQKEKE